MSLPRFIDRAADASLPVLADLTLTAFLDRLSRLTVGISIDAQLSDDPAARSAYLLAVNLAARLYPRLVLRGPDDLRKSGADLAASINPAVEVGHSGRVGVGWSWSRRAPRPGHVHTAASGWNVGIDGAFVGHAPAEAPAALAAAAIGAGEIFRTAFADELGPRGRTGLAPFAFNLLTLGAREDDLPSLGEAPAFGRTHLAGAGAIGEAVALTLREAGATGTLVAVDPESIDLTNLQRYLLALDRHVDARKVAVLTDQLAGTSIVIEQVATLWGAGPETQTAIDTILAAVDTVAGRIQLQASLPRRVYNAYTQPLDIGWSRHESFGQDACLTCLYWPTSPRPHRHEVLGAALKADPARVLVYLVAPELPIGQPIPPQHIRPEIDRALAAHWTSVPLAEDIGRALFDDPYALTSRADARVDDLYHDLCAGTLLPTVVGERDREVIVPVAHQSALAGIMLATQLLIVEQPQLAALRPPQPQARFDVFRSAPPQPLPLARAVGCICGDDSYIDAYRARWQPRGER